MQKHQTILLLGFLFIIQACAKSTNKKATPGPTLNAFEDVAMTSTFNEKMLTDLPRKVVFNDKTSAVKFQGERGTSTLFSTMALIESAIKIDKGQEVNLSEEYMNYVVKSLGLSAMTESSQISENIEAMKLHGILLESDWGYQPSWFQKGFACEGYTPTDALAPADCFKHNRPDEKILDKAFSANGISLTPMKKNTNDIIRFMAKEKRPLSLNLIINRKGWSTSEVTYGADLRRECVTKPDSCAVHSVILTGYDLDAKVFHFKYSWGKVWGKNGFGTIKIETVDLYSKEDLYYAEVDGKFELPKDFDKESLEFQGLRVKAKRTKEKDLLELTIETMLSGAAGKSVLINNELVTLNEVKEKPTDKNTSPVVHNNKKVQIQHLVTAQSDQNTLRFSWLKPLKLDLAIPDPAQLEDEKLFIKSTIKVHTDTEGFKTLGEVYQAVKEKRLNF